MLALRYTAVNLNSDLQMDIMTLRDSQILGWELLMSISMTLSRFRILLFLALLLLASSLPVSAATIHIDSNCDLDHAIKAANRDEEVKGCERGDGHDTIVFQGEVEFGRKMPVITSSITILGNNHPFKVKHDNAIFTVEEGRLTIRNLNARYAKKRTRKIIELEDAWLEIVDSTFGRCKRGIEQKRSHTTITGNVDICELEPSEFVKGGYSANVSLSLPVDETPRTCESLPASIMVTAPHSGVQCTHLDAVGVGNQAVVNMGVIDAVDVWAYVEQGVEVCFSQSGRIVFLDAATSPRSQAHVESYLSGGKTCAYLQRPGGVVLVQGQTEAEKTAPTTATTTTTVATQPVTTTTTTTVTQPTVDGCPIRTTGNLRLRATPSLSAETLGYVLRGTNLGYVDRTAFWFKVRHYGVTGWIGWKYVEVIGACG